MSASASYTLRDATGAVIASRPAICSIRSRRPLPSTASTGFPCVDTVSPSMAWKIIDREQLRSVRIGRAVRVRPQDLVDYLADPARQQ